MIRDRLFEVIYHQLGRYGAIKKISEESQISLSAWQTAAASKQRANEEMIEFVCKKWPEFSLYISTGKADQHVQTTPHLEQIRANFSRREALLKKDPITWTNNEKNYIKNEWEVEAGYGTKLMGKEEVALGIALQANKNKTSITIVDSSIKKQLNQGLKADFFDQKIKLSGFEIGYGNYCIGYEYLDELNSQNEHQKN